MKVLFLISDANARGGTEILAYHLLDEMREIGIDCWLLSRWQFKGNDSRVLSLNAEEYSEYIATNNSILDKLLGRRLSDAILRKAIKRISKEKQIDWVVNNTYDLIGTLPTGEDFKTAQVFNWSVNGYEETVRSASENKGGLQSFISACVLQRKFKRWHFAMLKLTRLIMLTEAAVGEIQNLLPSILPQQMVVIPDPIMQTSTALEISSLKNKTLIFVGRLSQEKGVMRLLRIWNHIEKRVPEYQLLIYGEGDLRGEMMKYVEEVQLKRVHMMGFCDDLKSIYANADLCLVTSDTEGFGMVLVEAMYYGVPCVSFDCPISPKEILSDAGITIPCFNEEVYADTVVSLLSDENKLRALQQKAVIRASDFYSNKIVDKWVKMFNDKE